MPTQSIDASRPSPAPDSTTNERAAARIAGVAFLFIVVGWTLNWIFVDARIVVAGNAAQTVANVRADELLLRVGLANELLFAVGAIVLAFALYVLLERVNRNLALLALGVKLIEASLGAALVLAGFIALRMLDGGAALRQDIIGGFLTVRSTGATISMVFLGVDSILFFSLLFQSRYVPRALSGLGVFAYALILIQSFIGILMPSSASADSMVNRVSMTMFAPSVVFELLMGLWLLVKGAKVAGQWRDPAESASTARSVVEH